MFQSRFSVFALSTIVLSTALAGCSKEEAKYEPLPAVSEVSAKLPDVPTVPEKPVKDGDAYTVWGASYYQRNRVHEKEVLDQKVSIVGYVTRTNFDAAPECAVHDTGKADPEDCKPPIPTFWIGDSKDAPENEQMKVMGFASNFANIYHAIEEFDKAKEDEPAVVSDATWGIEIPNPLPTRGAKVKISGTYSTSFTMASSGIVADPIMGVLTYGKLEYIEKPTDLATLPGMKPRKPKK
jgi:hypothetical protein